MKLSIFTGGVWRRNSKMTDIEVISELADIGFRVFDYTFPGDEIGFENTVYMTAGWKEAAETLSAFMKEHGYAFGQAHIPLGGIFGNPLKSENEELMWKGYIRAFEAASVLGAPIMVLHPGMEGPDMTKEDFFKKFKAFIDRLLGEVGQFGIKIALENLAPFDFNYRYVQTGKDLCELIEYIDHPLVGACWDTDTAIFAAPISMKASPLSESIFCASTWPTMWGSSSLASRPGEWIFMQRLS